MTNVLKGNFQTQKAVDADKQDDDVESRFETEALKHLGGSIAFVSKKRVKWDSKEDK
jgi:hypothetical protein